MKRLDVVGKVFGRLTVVGEGPYNHRNKRRTVVCRCECGAQVVAHLNNVTSGTTNSCGCYCRDRVSETKTTHGRHGTPEYTTWCLIRQRCYNPNDPSYPDYGGRGIRVCKRWLGGFAAFYADMGPKPSPDHSIERKNNARNYTPKNCCWATRSEQNKNRRPFGEGRRARAA